jgi:hypothetical protein
MGFIESFLTEQDDFHQLVMEDPAVQQDQKLYHSSFLMAKDLEVCFNLINSIAQPFVFIIKEICSQLQPLNLLFSLVQAKEYVVS